MSNTFLSPVAHRRRMLPLDGPGGNTASRRRFSVKVENENLSVAMRLFKKEPAISKRSQDKEYE